MDPAAAAWGGPCEFQLATTNYWCAQGAAPAPGGGFPMEYYASMGDMFAGGTCSSLRAYVPESSVGQQQLVDQYNYNYYAAAATQHDDDGNPTIQKAAAAQESFRQVVDLHKTERMEEYLKDPISLFHERAEEFRIDILGTKMHRYPAPPTMPDLGEQYKEPCVVAIGPYHHGLDRLEPAEEVKHVAAYHCIMQSRRRSVEELYGAVESAVKGSFARHLYHKDVMAGVSDRDFLPMMFYDACFLVQCMVWYTTDDPGQTMDASLVKFFDHNRPGIRHDIMLLENQIPWRVVEAVLELRDEDKRLDLEKFIALWKDSLQDRKVAMERLPRGFLDKRYKAPHLLGLLRFYIVGKISSKESTRASDNNPKVESLSFSASPVELAEMGIILNAKGETTELAQVGFKRKWCFFFAELSLPPLTLTEVRASRLVNMAAHEVCATTDFFSASEEDSAVCSYLRVLCMLVQREDDVHQLRANGILQGGAGLSNKEVLEFFTKFQNLPYGPCYARVMDGIDRYRAQKWFLIMMYGFLYRRDWKTIIAVISVIGTLAGILLKLLIKS